MTTTVEMDMLTVFAADFTASAQPQPFPLQGSKRGQVPIINRLLPIDCSRLVEPFCGSAVVSIGARYHRKTEQVAISDTNLSLMRLWQSILTDATGLACNHHVEDFMPLCPSCNRSKSWACEHCPNRMVKDISVCKACMWASPKNYTHVATQQVREFRGTLYDHDDIRRYDEQHPDVPEVLSEYMKRVDEGTQAPLTDHHQENDNQSHLQDQGE